MTKVTFSGEANLPDNIVTTDKLEEALTLLRKEFLNQTDPETPVDPPAEPPVDETPLCAIGVTIEKITDITNVSLTVVFNAVDVREAKIEVKDMSDKVMSWRIVKPTSAYVPITYGVLSPGDYKVVMTAINCRGSSTMNFQLKAITDPGTPPPVTPPPSDDPVVAPPVVGQRQFILNLTGGGFNPDLANGLTASTIASINPWLKMTWQGKTFRAIQGLRVNIKWWQWEPNFGTYDKDGLLKLYKFCIKSGLALHVCFVPYRRTFSDQKNNKDTESQLAVSERATGFNGEIWDYDAALNKAGTYWSYQPSFASEYGRQLVENAIYELMKTLKDHNPDYVGYASIATSNTEEFQMPVNEGEKRVVAGFSDADKREWAKYAPGEQIPSYNYNDIANTYYGLFGQASGRKWYDFQTEQMAKMFSAFTRGVHKAGALSCGYYGGVGAGTQIIVYSAYLNIIFADADIIYSTEGDPNANDRKNLAADVNRGTFPSKIIGAETDHHDIDCEQRAPDKVPAGNCLNPDILDGMVRSLFRRGVSYFHFAMTFTPSNIPTLSQKMYELNKDFIETDAGMIPMPQGEAITANPFTDFTYKWRLNGSSYGKQVLVKLVK